MPCDGQCSVARVRRPEVHVQRVTARAQLLTLNRVGAAASDHMDALCEAPERLLPCITSRRVKPTCNMTIMEWNGTRRRSRRQEPSRSRHAHARGSSVVAHRYALVYAPPTSYAQLCRTGVDWAPGPQRRRPLKSRASAFGERLRAVFRATVAPSFQRHAFSFHARRKPAMSTPGCFSASPARARQSVERSSPAELIAAAPGSESRADAEALLAAIGPSRGGENGGRPRRYAAIKFIITIPPVADHCILQILGVIVTFAITAVAVCTAAKQRTRGIGAAAGRSIMSECK